MSTGPEVYTMALLSRASEALETAIENLEGDHLTAAVNRAYYAAFFAARAVLYQSGETPATHKGVKTRFYELVVRGKQMDQGIAGILTVAQEARQSADYDALSVFESSSVKDLIDDVQRFVESCRLLIGHIGSKADPST